MNANTLILSRAIHDEIIAHARSGAPEEVCGVISGRDGIATELVRARNEAENRVMDYWVDGGTLLRQFDFEDRGESMIAIYHSHPVDPAYPSATDARNAFYPDSAYLICSLLQPSQPVIRGYLLIQEELAERPAGLTPVRGNPRFLAQHHAGPLNPCYDLVTLEEDGSERWQRVQVVEQEIVVAESPPS